MVAPIENLTALVGTITERVPHPDLEGWDLVTLSREHTESVPGKNDLLSGRTDETLRVAVRRDLLGDAAKGWRLSARARLTPAGLLAEPYPADGNFQVEEPPSYGA